MPYDDTHKRDDDPQWERRHEHIDEVIFSATLSMTMSAAANDQCASCCAYQLGLTTLAKWIAVDITREFEGEDHKVSEAEFIARIGPRMRMMSAFLTEEVIKCLKEMACEDE